MVLPGTHRLVDRYRQALPAPVGAGKENWLAFMRHHPWLARLLDSGIYKNASRCRAIRICRAAGRSPALHAE
jgi:hypothetical protein